MKEYTSLRNKNRGYLSLDVWKKAVALYKLVCKIVYESNQIDFKLRAQIADAAQSVSANIAEGYSRRSINEYIQHVYIALGSLSETLSRAVALFTANQISQLEFTELDTLHFEVENKLWRLLQSLEKKRDEGTWITKVSDKTRRNPSSTD
ncbi:MAG: four helix bundle protein [Calditrichaeota bacterium]|nr:MAG: four helix bundle protein [Calditrichota bacterium]